MKQCMKIGVSLMLAASLCMGIAGCGSDVQPEAPAEGSGYSLVEENGQHYIVIKDEEAYANYKCDTAAIDFSSLSEFRDAVVNGTLLPQDVAKIAQAFPRTENGYVRACDFDNMYVPLAPGEYTVDGVSWEGGEAYTFRICLQDGVDATFQYLSGGLYDEIYNRDYRDFFEKDTITVRKTEVLDTGETVTEYDTGRADFRSVRYVLTGENKTIQVDKTYRDASDAPYKVKLFGTVGTQRFVVTVLNVTTEPTDDWLVGFGLEKYDGTNDIG